MQKDDAMMEGDEETSDTDTEEAMDVAADEEDSDAM